MQSGGKRSGEEFRIAGEDADRNRRAELFLIDEHNRRRDSRVSRSWKVDGSASRATASERG